MSGFHGCEGHYLPDAPGGTGVSGYSAHKEGAKDTTFLPPSHEARIPYRHSRFQMIMIAKMKLPSK
jgi:hypothetical protein